jgi:glycosyltransferase involved in cell wall biosynthesis
LAIVLRPVFKYKLVVDAHNSGVFPEGAMARYLIPVSNWIQRKADITIVTNSDMAASVHAKAGRAVVLPDRLPDVDKSTELTLDGRFNVVCVCKFRIDEPFKEVIRTAQLLPEDTVIYITGKYTGIVDANTLPANVCLTGFVPDATYWALLSSADLVMDLTLREGCLVCGAYEAVALSKPLILSNTKALRSYFNQGCVYVEPNSVSIAAGVIEARKKIESLREDMGGLKRRIEASWKEELKELTNTIDEIRSKRRVGRRDDNASCP